MAHNTWAEVGVLAHTKPTTHRPVTVSQAYEGAGTLYGTPYRAVGVHSSGQDQRRQQRLARDIHASYSTLQSTARTAEQQAYCMRVTKFAGVLVVHLGDHRQLAHPLSVVQQQSLTALNVPVACFTGLKSGEGGGG